eukprot:jgi/Ulvmu1/1406/UM011_0135.1
MTSERKLVLVTVGTTKFDELIKSVDQPSLLSCLHEHGYSDMLVQQGRGSYRISNINPSPNPHINVQVEDYLPNLAAEIERASLVISHAGAGSIFESLTYQVPLIVVPNPVLMDNHQVELAKLMQDRNHAVSCSPDTVEEAVATIAVHKLDLYTGGDARPIGREIEELFNP